MADDVVALIAGAGMGEDCTISSFDEDTLRQVKRCDPRLATAYFLTEPRPFDPQEVIRRLGVGLLVVWPRAARRATSARPSAPGCTCAAVSPTT